MNIGEQRLIKLLENAFLAGFNGSSEGYNGEYCSERNLAGVHDGAAQYAQDAVAALETSETDPRCFDCGKPVRTLFKR